MIASKLNRNLHEMTIFSKCIFKTRCLHGGNLSCQILLGGQSGTAVTSPHGNHQDVCSNPAADRNEKTDIGQTPAQKVPQ